MPLRSPDLVGVETSALLTSFTSSLIEPMEAKQEEKSLIKQANDEYKNRDDLCGCE